jgi:hypothetical protein
MDLLDLIRYENENTRLDFKAVPYKGEQSEALLKDIMAMANATVDGDRYIVVGVKHYPNEEREILGVDEYIDDASYYQLVHSNIEPDISLEYSYLSVDDKKVGYFRIFNCDDPPYMFKKDGNKFKRGDSYIRKGTSNMRVVRSDINRMFQQRQTVPELANNIDVVLVSDAKICTTLEPWTDFMPPSEEQAKRIRGVIADKEREAEKKRRREAEWAAKLEANKGKVDLTSMLFRPINEIPSFSMPLMPGGTTYEERDIPTLKGNLVNVKHTYKEDDLHYMYEIKAHKINFRITNNGEQYIENCSIKLDVKRNFGFIIPSKIQRKPVHNTSAFGANLHVIHPPSFSELNYPEVKKSPESYTISQHIGDLEHSRSTDAFKTPFRLLLPADSAGSKLEITLSIFGKNLPKPFVETLLIDIV